VRELTKSVFSFSWAMSLFGAQQMFNLFRPSKAVPSFEQVTSATEEELARSLQGIFRMGDDVQRRMVDVLFGVLRADARQSNNHVPISQGTVDQNSQPDQTPPYNSTQRSPQSTASGWNSMPLKNSGPQQSAGVQRAEPAGAGPPEIPHEAGISAEYPFESRYVEVFGSRMHFIEEGTGEPIVFIHGNPTWSYLWRNVLPHLIPFGRCIALDLIGYGRSEKPRIEYKWTEQARYVEEFFRKMGLNDAVLVLHDWGVSLGLNYAMRHESRVKAIAFMEGIFRTFPQWDDFSTPEFRELFKRFREGGEGGEGWQLLVEQNFFIEHLLSGGIGRQLSSKEMDYYREPFTSTSSRIPIWSLARSVPVAGKPKEVWDAINGITESLKQSRLPKLLLYATPGGIVTGDSVDWCRQNLKNFKSVDVGPGLHYIQETTPHLIGRSVADWYNSLLNY
jgi:haloalkane dehalogenase